MGDAGNTDLGLMTSKNAKYFAALSLEVLLCVHISIRRDFFGESMTITLQVFVCLVIFCFFCLKYSECLMGSRSILD